MKKSKIAKRIVRNVIAMALIIITILLGASIVHILKNIIPMWVSIIALFAIVLFSAVSSTAFKERDRRERIQEEKARMRKAEEEKKQRLEYEEKMIKNRKNALMNEIKDIDF